MYHKPYLPKIADEMEFPTEQLPPEADDKKKVIHVKLAKDSPKIVQGKAGDLGYRLELNQTWAKKLPKHGKVKKYVECMKMEMSMNLPRDAEMKTMDLSVKVLSKHKHVSIPLKQSEETASRSVAYFWGLSNCHRLHQYPFKNHVQMNPVLYAKEDGKAKSYPLPRLELVLASKEEMGPKPTGKTVDFPTEDANIVRLVPENACINMALQQYTLIENVTVLDVAKGNPPESVNFCGEQYTVYQNSDGLHVVVDRDLSVRAIVRQRYRTDINLVDGGKISCL